MESHVKRCLQQHVLTWNPVSIGSEAWFDMELHVNSMMARSMSNAAFSTCLGVYHIDMGCHVKLMPPRTYNFDMKLHAKFDMGSMSNGLTQNFMSKSALGAYGNDSASIWHGIPFQRVISKVGDGGTSVLVVFCLQLGPQTEYNRSRNWPPKQLRKRGW